LTKMGILSRAEYTNIDQPLQPQKQLLVIKIFALLTVISGIIFLSSSSIRHQEQKLRADAIHFSQEESIEALPWPLVTDTSFQDISTANLENIGVNDLDFYVEFSSTEREAVPYAVAGPPQPATIPTSPADALQRRHAGQCNLGCNKCNKNCALFWLWFCSPYCESCEPGYVFSGYECIPCPAGCSSCTDATSCNHCATGFLFNGACVDNCPPGTYLTEGVCSGPVLPECESYDGSHTLTKVSSAQTCQECQLQCFWDSTCDFYAWNKTAVTPFYTSCGFSGLEPVFNSTCEAEIFPWVVSGTCPQLWDYVITAFSNPFVACSQDMFNSSVILNAGSAWGSCNTKIVSPVLDCIYSLMEANNTYSWVCDLPAANPWMTCASVSSSWEKSGVCPHLGSYINATMYTADSSIFCSQDSFVDAVGESGLSQDEDCSGNTLATEAIKCYYNATMSFLTMNDNGSAALEAFDNFCSTGTWGFTGCTGYDWAPLSTASFQLTANTCQECQQACSSTPSCNYYSWDGTVPTLVGEVGCGGQGSCYAFDVHMNLTESPSAWSCLDCQKSCLYSPSCFFFSWNGSYVTPFYSSNCQASENPLSGPCRSFDRNQTVTGYISAPGCQDCQQACYYSPTCYYYSWNETDAAPYNSNDCPAAEYPFPGADEYQNSNNSCDAVVPWILSGICPQLFDYVLPSFISNPFMLCSQSTFNQSVEFTAGSEWDSCNNPTISELLTCFYSEFQIFNMFPWACEMPAASPWETCSTVFNTWQQSGSCPDLMNYINMTQADVTSYCSQPSFIQAVSTAAGAEWASCGASDSVSIEAAKCYYNFTMTAFSMFYNETEIASFQSGCSGESSLSQNTPDIGAVMTLAYSIPPTPTWLHTVIDKSKKQAMEGSKEQIFSQVLNRILPEVSDHTGGRSKEQKSNTEK